MGAHQFIEDFCRIFTRKACYTRREFYLQILALFTTFRRLPLFPSDGRFSGQEKDLKEVAELIGSAVQYATRKPAETKASIEESIQKANSALTKYLGNYYSIDLHQHRQNMNSARVSDEQVAKLILKVESELTEKMEKLQRKSTRIIDLQVNQWSSDPVPEPKLLFIAGKLQIEDDANLSILIYRYMDYQLHYGDNLGVDVTLQLLRLNPQIYKHFPKSKGEWDGMSIKNKSDSEAKYIPCVNQTTTIRDYRSKGGAMYLVYDRHDSERRTHLTTKTLKTYRPSVEYTTAWFVTDSDYSAAVVRMNSLDYTLYYWELGQDLVTQQEELILYSSELLGVSPRAQTPSGYGFRYPSTGSSAPDAPLRPVQPPAIKPVSPSSRVAVQDPSNSSTRAPQPSSHSNSPPHLGPASPQPSRTLLNAPQPAVQPTPPLRANVVPSPPNRVSVPDRSGGATQQAPPKAAVDPPRQQKAAPVKDKSTKGFKAGPDAYRLQHKAAGGPNELIDEDTKRGGWFGSMVKNGLQRLGGYGGNSKS